MSKIIIASGPVIVKDNKVLLNKHGDSNFWKFCGGTVDDFEIGLLAHAQREFREEIGGSFELLDENPFVMYTSAQKNGVQTDILLVHYLASFDGEVKVGDDIREWKWIDINTLPEDLSPNIIPALQYFKYL